MHLVNSYNQQMPYIVCDMNNVPVEEGDLVEVQHCTGRYGQTQIVRGKLAKATVFGVYLIFDTPYTDYNGRHGSHTYPAGSEVQFAISHDKGRFYHEHQDFEHGHKTYMKKL